MQSFIKVKFCRHRTLIGLKLDCRIRRLLSATASIVSRLYHEVIILLSTAVRIAKCTTNYTTVVRIAVSYLWAMYTAAIAPSTVRRAYSQMHISCTAAVHIAFACLFEWYAAIFH